MANLVPTVAHAFASGQPQSPNPVVAKQRQPFADLKFEYSDTRNIRIKRTASPTQEFRGPVLKSTTASCEDSCSPDAVKITFIAKHLQEIDAPPESYRKTFDRKTTHNIPSWLEDRVGTSSGLIIL